MSGLSVTRCADEHTLRIPMLWMGAGIKAGSTLDFPGTQVDHAPTILGLAGIGTPNYMDGVSIVPLLVRKDTAEAQGQRLPGSVEEHLRRTAAPPKRIASYHTYYNQGPWFTGCDPGDPVAGSWCKRKAVAPYDRHRLDDWSNTWQGLFWSKGGQRCARAGPLACHSLSDLVGRHRYKYGEFDPYGKQSNFSRPYMRVLFDLNTGAPRGQRFALLAGGPDAWIARQTPSS